MRCMLDKVTWFGKEESRRTVLSVAIKKDAKERKNMREALRMDKLQTGGETTSRLGG